MRKVFIAMITVTALSILTLLNSIYAQDKMVFAIVPQTLDNPFFERVRTGCKTAENELDGVECLYIGPGQHTELGQLQIVKDLITRKVDGIAVAPADAAAIAEILREAKTVGVPVITWNSDVLAEDKDARITHLGTKHYDIGVNLAQIAMKLKPEGGTICIQSGDAATAKHNERIQGIRDTMSGAASDQPPGNRLQDTNGWSEVEDCPLYANDDFPLSVQQMDDILAKFPDLTAFVATGGFPQWVPEAYRQVAEKHLERIKNQDTVLVVADTLPVQMAILKDGLSHGQVGQRPFEMGYKAMFILKDLVDGKAVEDPIYSGLDVCEPENQDSCLSG